jgi:Superinfection exclusion gene product 17
MNKDIANDNIEIRIWWIPQVPMKPFYFPVPTVQAAKMLCNALAQYDLFQYKNNIKPDYDNAGGASWRHPKLTDGEWYDFDPEDDAECEEIEAAIAQSATGI